MPECIRVTASVRKHGAIGVFYPREFVVELRCPKCGYTEADQFTNGDHRLCGGTIPSLEDYKAAWFAQYGDPWELHHFIGAVPCSLP